MICDSCADLGVAERIHSAHLGFRAHRIMSNLSTRYAEKAWSTTGCSLGPVVGWW
ncbi:hypothetical protein ACFPRL_03570 [Pseudoclavibacter helvolus]